MRKKTGITAATALLMGLLSAGCGGGSDKDKAGGKTDKAAAKDGHDHAHDHGPGTLNVGKLHVNLRAYTALGELEISFETHAHKVAPQDAPSFDVQVRLDGGEFQKVSFQPAPKEGRKDDPEGRCSRFLGKVPGLDKAKKVTAAAKVALDGKEETLEWRDVDPEKLKH